MPLCELRLNKAPPPTQKKKTAILCWYEFVKLLRPHIKQLCYVCQNIFALWLFYGLYSYLPYKFRGDVDCVVVFSVSDCYRG